MNARALALAALSEWRRRRHFADAIIQHLLGSSDLSASDRAFANELFYGVLRNLTLLDFWIAQLRSAQLDDETRDLLRLGLYQLMLLSTPAHAAVNETVALAPARTRGVINGVLRNAQRRSDILKEAATSQALAVQFSHPDFLVRKWQEQFGHDSTRKLCAWDNQPPPVFVRINELKTSREDFLHKYFANLLPNSTRFAELPNPWPAVAAGECYVQDPSTAIACEILAPQPNETVLDACAAPGGKTSFLAQLMENRGHLLACDRDARRLAILIENLQRLGITNAQVLQHDWRRDSPSRELNERVFDRILVDAPCSNTGVMRRRVDVRWRLQPGDFTRMPNEQLGIVRAVLPLLKPGGVLVYSTCSIEPEENERVVERLLKEFSLLRLDESKSVLPFRDHIDGAFAAKLTRLSCN